MKKIVALLLAFTLFSALCACGEKNIDRADGIARELIGAILVRDTQTLDSFTHPDHLEDVVYDDAFYETLGNFDIFVGEPLDNFVVGNKRYIDDELLGGRVYVCEYIVQIDQMPYDLIVTFLDGKESGFGVIAVSVKFCTDLGFYDEVSA